MFFTGYGQAEKRSVCNVESGFEKEVNMKLRSHFRGGA